MQWMSIINKANTNNNTIIAISDEGLMLRKNGTIEPIPYRQNVKHNGKLIRCYRLLMEYFKPKTNEDITLGRDCIDHITHNPTDMNINDIRNMRWCTCKENLNFEEAKRNNSLSRKGKPSNKKGKGYSEFGKLFKEMYGCSKSDEPLLYDRERMYYKKHGYLRGNYGQT